MDFPSNLQMQISEWLDRNDNTNALKDVRAKIF